MLIRCQYISLLIRLFYVMILTMTHKDNRIGYLLKGAQQALRNKMDAQLTALGLTTSQYSALSHLERAGSLSNAQLAEACFVTPQTMTRIVKTMHGLRWLEKEQHPTHGKIITLTLSPKGKALVSEAHSMVANIEEEMLQGIPPKTQAQLRKHLEHIIQNLG